MTCPLAGQSPTGRKAGTALRELGLLELPLGPIRHSRGVFSAQESVKHIPSPYKASSPSRTAFLGETGLDTNLRIHSLFFLGNDSLNFHLCT